MQQRLADCVVTNATYPFCEAQRSVLPFVKGEMPIGTTEGVRHLERVAPSDLGLRCALLNIFTPSVFVTSPPSQRGEQTFYAQQ